MANRDGRLLPVHDTPRDPFLAHGRRKPSIESRVGLASTAPIGFPCHRGFSPKTQAIETWSDTTWRVDLIRSARVLYAGTNAQHNYLLLDKGSMDGIQPRMAVVQGRKIVGQVQAVSPRFARVIPLINTKLRTSALHTASQTTGSLVWTGGPTRYAELMDFPIHIPIKVGDSLVSSTYSSVYPPGLRLGRIDRIETVPGAITYKIRVMLSVDYHRLDHVQVMRPMFQKEREELLPDQN